MRTNIGYMLSYMGVRMRIRFSSEQAANLPSSDELPASHRPPHTDCSTHSSNLHPTHTPHAPHILNPPLTSHSDTMLAAHTVYSPHLVDITSPTHSTHTAAQQPHACPMHASTMTNTTSPPPTATSTCYSHNTPLSTQPPLHITTLHRTHCPALTAARPTSSDC